MFSKFGGQHDPLGPPGYAYVQHLLKSKERNVLR